MARSNHEAEEFEAFVARSYLGLVRFGALLVGEPGRGEDLVQSALIKTYGAWGRLSNPAAAGAYTRTVMVREAGRWRRRRWNGEQPSVTIPDVAPTEVPSDSTVERVTLIDALLRLPLNQRAVLLVRFFEGLSEQQTAELLGISVGTVKSRTSRAIAALRSDTSLTTLDASERG